MEMPKWGKTHSGWWICGLLIILAALIRLLPLPNIGSLSFDEAWSVWIAKKNLMEALSYIAGDKHPPLFYFTLAGWIRLFGDSELILRLMSVLWGTVSVACLYLLGTTMFSPRVGFTAALLMAISPFQVFYSQEARMYPMAQVFVLLSAWFLWKLRQDDRLRNWLFYIAVTIAMVFTHYIAALSLLGQAVFLLIDTLKNHQRLSLFKKWLIGLALVALPGIIWLPQVYRQVVLLGGAPQWISVMLGVPSLKDFILLFTRDLLIPFPEYTRLIRLLMYLLTACLLILAILKTPLKLPRIQLEISDSVIFCFLCLVPPVGLVWVISQFDPTFVPRYFLPLSGFFYLILADGLQKIPWRRLRWPAVALIVLVLAYGSFMVTRWPRERDWKTISAYITDHWQNNDVLVIIPPANWLVFMYYTGDQFDRDINFYRDLYPDYPQAADDATLQHTLLDQTLPYKRLWWIDEKNTGLAAEWQVDPELSVQAFLDNHFVREDIPANLSGATGSVKLYDLEAIK